MIGQLMALAQWHQDGGRALEAEALYRRALDIEPRSPPSTGGWEQRWRIRAG